MNNSLEELRYPWNDALEFWTLNYWSEIEAIHLVLGWAFILLHISKLFYKKEISSSFKLSTVYFSLMVFTNPAYNFFGLSINEIFGTLSVLFFACTKKINEAIKVSYVAIFLLLTFVISITHALISVINYPELTPDFNTAFLKLAVNIKIFIVSINVLIILHQIEKRSFLEALVRACLAAGSFGLFAYIAQLTLLASGKIPYGTYLDAGFVGFPSFGSVSIERGHFGKFMAPYFPFFLYAFVVWGDRIRFGFYCLITSINFSASSQVFFLFSIFISFILLRKNFGRIGYLTFLIILSSLMVFMIINYSIIEGIFDKIITIAILGDESQGGGRSIGVFLSYMDKYPFGMGYSGSILRTAPSLPEINAGYLAFLSQYSILAIPLILGYSTILIKTVRVGLKKNLLQRCMTVGAITSALIFFSDILWFLPLVWLSVGLAASSRRVS